MKTRIKLNRLLVIPATVICSVAVYGVATNAAVGATPNQIASNQSVIKGAAPDVACEVGALPNLQKLSERQLEMVATNPFANPPSDIGAVLTRVDAAKAARLSSTDPEGSVDAPVAATQVPYNLAAKWIGDSNELIAPERCVWVATVEATFTPIHHGPIGSKPRTFDRYTVVMDAASGQGISLNAGPGEPDLFTGIGLN
jgi:hypothetical protein